MGIPADKMVLYPGGSTSSPEWMEIRRRIAARAGDCCEKCGVENHALGGRTADGEEVAIYRSLDDGELWVRPRYEFEDGRFEALK